MAKIVADEGVSAAEGVCCVLAARAILECYIATIPDQRADDRFVLWTVRDKLDEAAKILEDL
jgi:hypothetical protein